MSLHPMKGSPGKDDLAAVSHCSQAGARAWRRTLVWERARKLLAPFLLGMVLTVLGLEFGAADGVQVIHLPWLFLGLLGPILGGVSALFVRLTEPAVLTEIDRRSQGADRLGTAWEFASSSAPLAASQRADAEVYARELEVAALFPLRGGTQLRSAGLLLLLFLTVLGTSLSFQVDRSKEEGVFTGDDAAMEELLESIESDRAWFDERGDKRAVAILTDLERTIREIEARETELQKVIQSRPEPDSLPEQEKEAEEDGLVEDLPRSDLLSVEDIERMEAEFVEQLRLSDAQEAELVGQLIERSSTAEALIQRLEEHIHHEHNVSFGSGEGVPVPDQSVSTPFDDLQSGQGLTGNRQIDQAMGDVGNPIEQDMDLHTRDLSAEAQVEHDATHDTQQSFNQFLQEFAGDLQEMAAEQATGRKRNKGKDNRREVKGNMGQGVADKSSAMEERGFEEVGSQKRHSAEAPPEDLAGLEPGAMGENGSKPEGGGPMSSQMMAMKGPATGETSPGSSGAGTGSPTAGREGLKAMLQELDPQQQTPIEDLMSQMGAGRMPPEQRDALFEQLARLQVQTSAGADAENDLTTDYFRDADELLVANREQLPPLFRDYAHDYFEAIRPDEESKDEP